MKKNANIPQESKTDLRHDTMEFSANHDGDDILDTDIRDLDDDEISAEELDFLEEDKSAMAAALNEVEDEEPQQDEEWTDDLADENYDS